MRKILFIIALIFNPLNAHANFRMDETAFGDIDGTYAQVLVPVCTPKILFVLNNTDVELKISFDGGVTDGFLLSAGSSRSVDYLTNNIKPHGMNIHAKDTGDAAASGSLVIEYAC